MKTDDTTSVLIELGDMSKLRVLARFRSSGQFDHAKDIADEIEGADAKAVAQCLLQAAEANGSTSPIHYTASSSNGHAVSTNGAHPSPKYLAVAQDLEQKAVRA